jgi:DNA-binding GntR family transcriptional regulator
MLPGAQALRRRSSAAARAYEVAKARLLDGSYQPGALLSENELARELGISRTPVREAFLQLEAEDLIELYPRRGALVKPIEPSEADDVLEARLLIETHCVIRVAQGDRRLVGLLRDLVDEQELAVRTADGPPFVIADREFHRQIVDANGNPLLTRQYDALRDRQQRIAVSAVARDPERVARFIAEHAAVVEAIATGDGRLAAERIDAHLRGAHELSRRPRP